MAAVHRGHKLRALIQKKKKLQQQKILIFIYPIYNHNWRNINTVYIYITRLASNKIHQEVGQAKDLSAFLYNG
jgi:hypothetical protein